MRAGSSARCGIAVRRRGKSCRCSTTVQGELTSIPQTKIANAGTYSYKYADLADVVSVAYPIMSKHGLAYLARPTMNETWPVRFGVLR